MIVQDQGGGDVIHLRESSVNLGLGIADFFSDIILFLAFEYAVQAVHKKRYGDEQGGNQKQQKSNQEFGGDRTVDFMIKCSDHGLHSFRRERQNILPGSVQFE